MFSILFFKDIPRARKRLTELLIKTGTGVLNDAEKKRREEAHTEWYLTFLRSPIEITPDSGGERVAGVKLAINKLEVNVIFILGVYQEVFNI